MSDLRVFVETSDKYNWALKPFIYLFNIYWSELQPVVIAGYTLPNFDLPSNFAFHSIDSHNYPAERWSDGMIKFLNAMPDSHFVLLLCDYWLTRTVDVRGVQACYEYVRAKDEVLRIDLTTDRLYTGGMFDVEPWGCYDIIETPFESSYQMSVQAGIWNRQRMLEVLVPGKTAWEAEIHTQPPPEMRVLGTRQRPVAYANAILKGELQEYEVDKIPQSHRDIVRQWIPGIGIPSQ